MQTNFKYQLGIIASPGLTKRACNKTVKILKHSIIEETKVIIKNFDQNLPILITMDHIFGPWIAKILLEHGFSYHIITALEDKFSQQCLYYLRKANEVLTIPIKSYHKFDITTCPIQQENFLFINKIAFLRFLERNCWVLEHSINIFKPSLLDPAKNTIALYTDSEQSMIELESFRMSTINKCTLCSYFKLHKLKTNMPMFVSTMYVSKLIKRTDYFTKKGICVPYKGKKYLVDRAFPFCITKNKENNNNV